MTYNSKRLLELLKADVRNLILQAQSLENFSDYELRLAPAPDKWSAAQVLEHLNIYSRYYHRAIEEQLHLDQTEPAVLFTPGWLGNYFTRLMKPRKDNTLSRKMKAPASAKPAEQPDGKAMLREFISHQHQLLLLLQIAETVNIGQIRIPTSLNKYIRLKLGDTFRFLIAHEQRHFIQISQTLGASLHEIQQAA